MRVLLLAMLVLGSTLMVAPAAQACPTAGCFGSCEVAYTEVWIVDGEGNGYGVEVPRGLECAW